MCYKLIKLIKFSHEVGDAYSFCNPEEGKFLKSRLTRKNKNLVELQTGNCFLGDYKFDVSSDYVKVSTEVHGSVSSAMDLVFRLTMNPNDIEYIEYGGERFIHKNSNIYKYIYKSPQVIDFTSIIIKIKNGNKFLCTFIDNIIFSNENWKINIYVRDEVNKWIIHFRFMPLQGLLITKNCTSWWRTQPIPGWIQPLFRIRSIARYFLYRAELNPRGPIHRRIINLTTYIVDKLEFTGSFHIIFRKYYQ